jgi:tRNA A-37 threonylcarbamoyl transferase component Bud32
MIGTQQCPQCRAPLAADAPEGLCPECLLGQAVGATGEWRDGSGPDTPHPGFFLPPRPAELAKHFPQLEILELLGQGGMGAVYKCRQTKLDRMVALKILPPAWGKDPAFAERFSREARALAQLSHPNTIAVHDFGETGGFYYFIMEYVDGANLRHLLQAGPIGPGEAVDVAIQVCDALQYAHEQGIIHRDIKPENILLDQRGRVKIADFGLAKLLGTVRPVFTLTGSHQVVGTPHYMAPEQMEKPQTVDHRADVYSLGVVFYEMLTGELPLGRFSAPSQKVGVDERLDHVVLKALDKEPERRYQRASELRGDLEALRAEVPLPTAGAPAPAYHEEVDREMARFGIAGPAAGLVLVGVVALLYWLAMGIAGLAAFLHDVHRGWVRSDEVFLAITLGVIGIPVVLLASGFLVIAGRRMARFESYPLVVLGCLWAMIPWSAAWLIGFPVGLWGLWVLRRDLVKLTFARRAVANRLGVAVANIPDVIPVGPRRGGMVGRAVKSLYRGMLSLVVGSQVRTDPALASGAGSPGAKRSPVPLGAGLAHGGLRRPLGGFGSPAVLPQAAPAPRRGWLGLGFGPFVVIAFIVVLMLTFAFVLLCVALSASYYDRGAVATQVAPRSVRNAPPADLNQWQYPGAQSLGSGRSDSSRHARFATTDDLDKVAKWYENLTGARLIGGAGGHGAATVGDIYYDYLDDSLAPPKGKIAKEPRPVAVRVLVVRTGQAFFIVAISRAEGEEQTHIALTRVEKR